MWSTIFYKFLDLSDTRDVTKSLYIKIIMGQEFFYIQYISSSSEIYVANKICIELFHFALETLRFPIYYADMFHLQVKCTIHCINYSVYFFRGKKKILLPESHNAVGGCSYTAYPLIPKTKKKGEWASNARYLYTNSYFVIHSPQLSCMLDDSIL